MFLCLLHQKKWKVLQQPRNPAVKVGLHRLRLHRIFRPVETLFGSAEFTNLWLKIAGLQRGVGWLVTGFSASYEL